MASWSGRCCGWARCGSSSTPVCRDWGPTRLCWVRSSSCPALWSRTTHRQLSGVCYSESQVSMFKRDYTLWWLLWLTLTLMSIDWLHVCVFRWLARLWNAVVVPRVEEAIISRVTAKRSSSSSSSGTSSSSSPSSQRPSPSNCGLSAGQQAVVKAALSILVNKAVLLGCPLPRHGAWAVLHMFHLPLFQSGQPAGKLKCWCAVFMWSPCRDWQIPAGVSGRDLPSVSHRLL